MQIVAHKAPTPNPPISSKTRLTAGTLTYTTGGLALLFFWLLGGDFTCSLKDRAVPPVMQILFKEYGASDMLTGLLFSSLPAIIGLFFGPLISYRSDRCRSPRGRRIPYLLMMTPVTALGMLGLAYSPQIGAFVHRFSGGWLPSEATAILATFGLFWALFEFGSIISAALFGGLVNDVVPQRVIGRFYGLFRAISLVVGIGFNYWLLGCAQSLFSWIFIGFGLLYGVSFGLICFRVKEGEYPPWPQEEHRGAIAAAATYFKECFSQPYYLLFFFATTVSGLAFSPMNLFSIFFANNIGMGMDTYGKCLAITYVFSLVLAYPLGALADYFHPIRLSIGALIIYVAVCIYGGLFTHTPTVFALALILHGVISGTYFTVSASLSQRLLPGSRYAELSSAGGMIGSLMGIPFAPLMGWFLDATGHDYRYTFFAGAGLSLLALWMFVSLYSKFMALGGPKNYVAPRVSVD